MRQSKRLRALAVIPFVALGLLAQSDDGQTATGQAIKVATHSSRWDYPRAITPGPGQEIHVVQKGDTLWDLGTQFLGNPFAWPQIWELNRWVKDPHWIYPGDPILVESSRGTVAAKGRERLSPREVADLQPDLRRARKPSLDEYAFTFQDFIQMPFLVPTTGETYFKQVGAFKLVGRQDSTRDMLADGDFLYVGGGSNQGVKPGDRLVVTRIVARKFYHPGDRHRQKVMGDILEQFGIIRITHVYPAQSVAIIEKSLDGITDDGYAAPYTEPATILNTLRTDIANPVQVKEPVSKVIFIRMNKAVASGGDLVIIDRGAQDGYKVGDVLLSARPTPLDHSKKLSPANSTNYYLGQLIVIRTGEHSATCRIMRSTEEVMVGDILTH
ncbi:MAG: LysM peptidoglycan-binding domain-containing protein [Holophaga sp.]|nr:LysM peptidoglycan-binding domain-containing protein [Holophaga sp.]